MIRILLAEDEHLIRSALAALLALEDDLTVVAEAATGAEAVTQAHASRPDVALLDLTVLAQIHVHRGHHHPVGQGDRADGAGGQQMRVRLLAGRHGPTLNRVGAGAGRPSW